jgi:hypothetical protein
MLYQEKSGKPATIETRNLCNYVTFSFNFFWTTFRQWLQGPVVTNEFTRVDIGSVIVRSLHWKTIDKN